MSLETVQDDESSCFSCTGSLYRSCVSIWQILHPMTLSALDLTAAVDFESDYL